MHRKKMAQEISLMLMIKLIFLILLQTMNCVNTEFYSSIHEMSLLVEYEDVFLKHMLKFISSNEHKLDFLNARLYELEREHNETLSTGSVYFENPINQYLLAKRLTIDWERIENMMSYRKGEKFLNRFEIFKNQTKFSYEEELNGGIAGILLLQEAYRLKTTDIASGILRDEVYDLQLDAYLCYDIGLHAIELNKTKLAHSWLMESLKRLPKLANQTHSLEETDILIALARTKTKLGDFQSANSTYSQAIDLKPDSHDIARAYMQFSQEYGDKESITIDYTTEHEPIPEDIYAAEQHMQYKLTCSGHIIRTPTEDRYLRCGYLTETHPFLLLAPIKVEELNHDPLLVQYYDVLSESEIEFLHQITHHRIERAKVMSMNGSVVSTVRTSQFLFVPKTEHKLLETIDERVADMTNLNMDYSEEHQFQNYGIGGHYAQHHDYFTAECMNTTNCVSSGNMGNRIATVLFYLSDVEQGGGTAFPYLKRHLLPKKGSAVFWYNLHASGEPDQRTLHGGCPIIVGSKWVLNRWIREYYQDTQRPCEVFNDGLFV